MEYKETRDLANSLHEVTVKSRIIVLSLMISSKIISNLIRTLMAVAVVRSHADLVKHAIRKTSAVSLTMVHLMGRTQIYLEELVAFNKLLIRIRISNLIIKQGLEVAIINLNLCSMLVKTIIKMVLKRSQPLLVKTY